MLWLYQRRPRRAIDGAWVDSKGHDTLHGINPTTEEPITAIALGNAEDVDRAVGTAPRAFEFFSQTSREERLELLTAFVGVYKARMAHLAAAVSQEMGALMGLATAAQVIDVCSAILSPAGFLRVRLLPSQNAGNSVVLQKAGFVT